MYINNINTPPIYAYYYYYHSLLLYSIIFFFAPVCIFIHVRFDLARKHTLFIVKILLAFCIRKQNEITTLHFL
jgi:hypothetical protein